MMLFFINVKQSKFHLKTLFILMFMLFSNKSKCQVLQNDEKDIFDSVLISYFDHYAYVKMNYNIDTIYLVKISYFTNKFMCYDWKYDSIYDVVHDVVQTFVINNEKVYNLLSTVLYKKKMMHNDSNKSKVLNKRT